MDGKQIGNNILAYLKEQNKTQVDLAKELNASKQVINKIVKGKKAIKISELISIADFLKVSFEDLIKAKQVATEGELESVHLYGKINNRETADFILSLVDNLSTMEEELAAHELFK